MTRVIGVSSRDNSGICSSVRGGGLSGVISGVIRAPRSSSGVHSRGLHVISRVVRSGGSSYQRGRTRTTSHAHRLGSHPSFSADRGFR
jgi:hypothetical protein